MKINKSNKITSNVIGKYFKEVRTSKLLSINEETSLGYKIYNGDKKSIDKLVISNLKFAISIAREYQGYGLPLEDLISEANLGLIKAASRFDVTKGFKFISYAVYWIRQTIMQSLNDNSRTIRLPSNIINELNKLNKLNSENIPTYAHCVSLNDYIKNNDNLNGTELKDLIKDERSHEFDIFKINKDKIKIIINNSLKILDKREKYIIDSYFGLNNNCEPMTLEIIGNKYNLTKERVRQIKNKALRKLRSASNNLAVVYKN